MVLLSNHILIGQKSLHVMISLLPTMQLPNYNKVLPTDIQTVLLPQCHSSRMYGGVKRYFPYFCIISIRTF